MGTRFRLRARIAAAAASVHPEPVLTPFVHDKCLAHTGAAALSPAPLRDASSGRLSGNPGPGTYKRVRPGPLNPVPVAPRISPPPEPVLNTAARLLLLAAVIAAPINVIV